MSNLLIEQGFETRSLTWCIVISPACFMLIIFKDVFRIMKYFTFTSLENNIYKHLYSCNPGSTDLNPFLLGEVPFGSFPSPPPTSKTEHTYDTHFSLFHSSFFEVTTLLKLGYILPIQIFVFTLDKHSTSMFLKVLKKFFTDHCNILYFLQLSASFFFEIYLWQCILLQYFI